MDFSSLYCQPELALLRRSGYAEASRRRVHQIFRLIYTAFDKLRLTSIIFK